MPKAVKICGLLAVFAVGLLLAWPIAAGGRAVQTTTVDTAVADTTTVPADTATDVTETTPTTTEPAATETVTTPGETVTTPGETVFSTTTVERTTTRILPLPVTGATTEASEESNGTDDWVWVLIAILAVGLITLIVL